MSQPSRRILETHADLGAVMSDAEQGDAPAMRLASLVEAVGLERPADWEKAVDWLGRAAAADDEESQGELLLLADDDQQKHMLGLFTSGQVTPPRWRELAASVRLDELLAPARIEVLSATPHIAAAQGLVRPEMATWLIQRAHPMLAPASVITPQDSRPRLDPSRTNSMVQIRFAATGLPVLALRHRLAGLVSARPEQLEITNILHYAPGQAFRPHYDGFALDAPIADADYAAGGQRLATVLVYLNEGYEGGETAFPRLNAAFKGRIGQALLWRNTLPGSRDIDPLTLHAGEPPSRGEKWVLSQWVRERPIPLLLD